MRGRGGAGFPAGVKWGFVPKDTGNPIEGAGVGATGEHFRSLGAKTGPDGRVSIVGDPAASETVLKSAALRKLEYVLARQQNTTRRT